MGGGEQEAGLFTCMGSWRVTFAPPGSVYFPVVAGLNVQRRAGDGLRLPSDCTWVPVRPWYGLDFHCGGAGGV